MYIHWEHGLVMKPIVRYAREARSYRKDPASAQHPGENERARAKKDREARSAKHKCSITCNAPYGRKVRRERERERESGKNLRGRNAIRPWEQRRRSRISEMRRKRQMYRTRSMFWSEKGVLNFARINWTPFWPYTILYNVLLTRVYICCTLQCEV